MNNKAIFKMNEISEKVVRRDYSKINFKFDAPNLLDVQINSYKKFLEKELESVIKSISPIHSPKDKYTLNVEGIILGQPKRTEEESRNDGKTFEAPLYVDMTIVDNETGEKIKAKKSKNTTCEGIFFANIPMMTKKGTFVINGIEKFVIAQIVRSPGVYTLPKSQIKLNSSRKKVIEGNVCEILPSKGTLMISTVVDSKKLINFTMRDASGETAPTINAMEFLRAFGISEAEIKKIFIFEKMVDSTIEQSVYTPSKFFDLKEMLELKNSVIELLSKTEELDEKIEVFTRGHKLEKNLKKLMIEYVRYDLEATDLINNLTDKNKVKLEELNNNKNIVLNKLITEKIAKDIVKKLSISLKVFDNNNIKISEDSITYQTIL